MNNYYEIKIPKILCLSLLIAKYVKDKKYFNTNDLIEIANNMQKDIVRLRQDKPTYGYRYLEDTNFGGLRGNFSTLLTLCGLVEKDNRINGYYSIGPDEKLINAVNKGEIILDKNEFKAFTKEKSLKFLLEQESYYLNVRESQAHIAAYLEKHKEFILSRDNVNYPKECVLKTSDNIYFYRILFNRFIDQETIEYNLLPYLQGTKIKKRNINVLFVVPCDDDNWHEFYAIESKEILNNTPLFLYFNIITKNVYDNDNNIYECDELISSFSKMLDENGNINERLNYDWATVSKSLVSKALGTTQSRSESEELIFIRDFLDGNMNNKLEILGNKVDKYIIHRAGVDLTLEFLNGQKQSVELEHSWKNYISHGHQKNIAWNNAWIFANEEFDFQKIKIIFLPYKNQYIPSIFLNFNPKDKTKHAYMVDWNTESFVELKISF